MKENKHTPTVNVELPKVSAKSVIVLQWNNEKQTATGILREKKNHNIVKRANTEQAMEQTASMTNNTHLRDGENVACVLRAHPTADLQQRKVRSAAAQAQQPPSHLEEQKHLPTENAHTLMSCKLLLQHSDLQQ